MGKYLLIYKNPNKPNWCNFLNNISFFLKNKFRLLQTKQLNKWHTMSMQFYCCHQAKQKAQRVGKHIYYNEFAVKKMRSVSVSNTLQPHWENIELI